MLVDMHRTQTARQALWTGLHVDGLIWSFVSFDNPEKQTLWLITPAGVTETLLRILREMMQVTSGRARIQAGSLDSTVLPHCQRVTWAAGPASSFPLTRTYSHTCNVHTGCRRLSSKCRFWLSASSVGSELLPFQYFPRKWCCCWSTNHAESSKA